jgi:hypothetical protein
LQQLHSSAIYKITKLISISKKFLISNSRPQRKTFSESWINFLSLTNFI